MNKYGAAPGWKDGSASTRRRHQTGNPSGHVTDGVAAASDAQFGQVCHRLKAESAIQDDVGQLRHKRDPMDIGEMAWPEDHLDEGDWEDAHAIGYAKGTAKGKTEEQGERCHRTWERRRNTDGIAPDGDVQGTRPGARKRPNTSLASATPPVRRVKAAQRGKPKGKGKGRRIIGFTE